MNKRERNVVLEVIELAHNGCRSKEILSDESLQIWKINPTILANGLIEKDFKEFVFNNLDRFLEIGAEIDIPLLVDSVVCDVNFDLSEEAQIQTILKFKDILDLEQVIDDMLEHEHGWLALTYLEDFLKAGANIDIDALSTETTNGITSALSTMENLDVLEKVGVAIDVFKIAKIIAADGDPLWWNKEYLQDLVSLGLDIKDFRQWMAENNITADFIESF